MKKLDGYVGRIAFGAFLAAMAFFLFLIVVVDLLGKLPTYSEQASKNGIGGFALAAYLGLHYLRSLPVFFTVVSPFATVIAAMFTVARLHNYNEIVPMLFVGRSIHRVLRPILWMGLIAGIGMICCWQWVVPSVGDALAASDALLKQGSSMQKFLVHETHEGKSRYLYVRDYDPSKKRMGGVRMLVQGDLAEDVSLTVADSAVWDEQASDWRLADGWVKQMRIDEPQQWLQRSDVTPNVLLQQSRETIDPELMSYTDLVALAEDRPNRADVKLALHRHITYPLANLLLLLLALPMAVRYERGSRVDRILAAIALCGAYMLTDLTCQRLGQRELLHPIVAAWTPTIVFGSLGAVLFSSTRT